MPDPYIDLAAEIIVDAIEDWTVARTLWRKTKPGYNSPSGIRSMLYDAALDCGYSCPRDELIDFFNSDWCTFLVESLGSQRQFIFERHNVPVVIYD